MSAPAQDIVNGVTTSSWPTVASLETDTGTCSATLIGCNTLLTAAHCVCDSTGTAGACPDGTSILDPANYIVFLPHMGEFGVRSVEIAPNYDFGTRSDLALLELDFPVRGLGPELINTLASPAEVGTASTIVGFGTMSGTDADSQIKREGDVVTSSCAGSGAPDATHICWTDPASTTCFGDSGGPLFADVGAGLTVAGVHSGGDLLCVLTDPAFDADVFVDSGWIASTGGADLGFGACGDGAQVGDASVVEDYFDGVVSTSADHSVTVGAGTKLLRVALNAEIGDPKNDLDLCVRFNAPASPGNCDCEPGFPNSMEVCEFPDPAAGTWNINVNVFAEGPAEYQVTALQLPENPAPPSLGDGDIIATDFRAFEVMHIDGTSGERAIFSSTLSGTGPQLNAPEGVVLSPSGDLIVANLGQPSVLSIDPTNANRAIVSGCDTELDANDNCIGTETGSGPTLLGPRFLAFESGGQLVLTDRSGPGTATVVRIDPMTGDRTLVSGSGMGSGPAFDTPFGIDVATNGDILVADSFGIVRVDPVTGDRTTISGSGTGTGPNFVRPGELHIESTGSIVVVDALRSLLRVDPSSGDRTVVSGCANAACSSVTGSGPQFTDQVLGLEILTNMAGDTVGYLVGDGELQALLRVNLPSGDRSILSGCANPACSSLVGSGTALTDPLGVVALPEPSSVLTLLAGSGLLLALRRRTRR